ncbi:hypothetical protein GWI33_013891 [Rhynchophorus ferrugineus]|uniref:Uncharacterized protein n=1 Tax=Rhynchophorus ferrugineus TaxID=354439 RepID=A0A834I3R5_RHYFE|nr:hypothetical protein GWI33_013891 [Rhynchophorus ferrugineus]
MHEFAGRQGDVTTRCIHIILSKISDFVLSPASSRTITAAESNSIQTRRRKKRRTVLSSREVRGGAALDTTPVVWGIPTTFVVRVTLYREGGKFFFVSIYGRSARREGVIVNCLLVR